MKYEEFCQRDHFDPEEVLALGHGSLIEDPPEGFVTRLPIPPMLMIDRVTQITRKGNKGTMTAERDVRLDDWFFQCHFIGDPVQPGCLGLDAVWQMLGMYCAWRGGLGAGRALGVGEVDFGGQIRPYNKTVRYEVKIARFVSMPASGACVVIGDASVLVDDEEIYTVKRARVGVFRDIDYPDYPNRSPNAVGGKTES